MEKSFEMFSDNELARAIELMISPSDLMSRPAMIGLLRSADFTPDEVREQLCSNEQLNDGPRVSWSF